MSLPSGSKSHNFDIREAAAEEEMASGIIRAIYDEIDYVLTIIFSIFTIAICNFSTSVLFDAIQIIDNITPCLNCA